MRALLSFTLLENLSASMRRTQLWASSGGLAGFISTCFFIYLSLLVGSMWAMTETLV